MISAPPPPLSLDFDIGSPLASIPENTGEPKQNTLEELLSIVQDSTITSSEKNLRFVLCLEKTQKIALSTLPLKTALQGSGLTCKFISKLETNQPLPFYIVNRNFSSSDLSIYQVPHVDFNGFTLSKLQEDKINENQKLAQIAQVLRIRTLQEWAHAYIYNLGITLPESMPQIQAASFSVVTLVPKITNTETEEAQWSLLLQGASGPKIAFYIPEESEKIAGFASSNMCRGNKFSQLLDPNMKPCFFKSTPVSTEQNSSACVQKIKETACNLFFIPVSPTEAYPKVIASPPQGPQNASILLPIQQIGNYHAKGKHKVDNEDAIHLKVHTLAVDVTGIQSKEELLTYLQKLNDLILSIPSSSPSPDQEKTAHKEEAPPVSIPSPAITETHTPAVTHLSPTSSPTTIVDHVHLFISWLNTCARSFLQWLIRKLARR